MLRYEQIHEVSNARRRMGDSRRNRYAWRQDGRTRDADQLSLFTFETQALADSEHNLEFLLATARSHDQRYVILTDTKIQIAGDASVDQVVEPLASQVRQGDFSVW